VTGPAAVPIPRHPRRHLVATLCLALALPLGIARAQETDSASMQKAYEERRAALLKDLQSTQDSLGAVRAQRVRLESRIDNVLARSTVQRAEELLLSGDLAALLQLDAILAQAQTNMTAQRDRMVALGDAVRKRSGAMLVVFFRADSAPEGAVTGGELQIDNTVAAARVYSANATRALVRGAVDELYRAEVLPTVHTLRLQETVNGQSIVSALNVQASANLVTYVQFSVKDGQVTSSTWTSQATTP
jgi:hypothetical protein